MGGGSPLQRVKVQASLLSDQEGANRLHGLKPKDQVDT